MSLKYQTVEEKTCFYIHVRECYMILIIYPFLCVCKVSFVLFNIYMVVV